LIEEESTALVCKMIGAIIGFVNVDADFDSVIIEIQVLSMTMYF